MIRFAHASCRAAGLTLAVVSLSSTPLTAQTAQKQSPGIEFDMKTTMTASGGMSAMLGGMPPGYTGHGFQIGNRVRIDIIDGSLPPLAEKGDYIVFDSSGMTIVHPAKKEYVPIVNFASKMLEAELLVDYRWNGHESADEKQHDRRILDRPDSRSRDEPVGEREPVDGFAGDDRNDAGRAAQRPRREVGQRDAPHDGDRASRENELELRQRSRRH